MLGIAEIVDALLAPLVVAPLAAGFVAVPVAAYVVSRWRHGRDYDVADPQLGLKAAWSFFKLVGFQVGVIGFFFLLYGIVSRENGSRALGLGASFFVPGALVFAIHAALMRRSNHKRFPHTMRMFSGLNMIMIGLGAVVATVFALALTLGAGSDPELSRMAWSLCATYILAYVVCTQQFVSFHVPSWRSSRDRGLDSSTPPRGKE